MFKNKVDGLRADICLHDCDLTKIELAENALTLFFEDGFWMLGHSNFNPSDKTLRTDASQVAFVGFDSQSSILSAAYVNRCVFCRNGKIPFERFIKRVNSGKWKVEILGVYSADNQIFLSGIVYQKGRCYFLDFDAVIKCEKIEYFWNDIRADREW